MAVRNGASVTVGYCRQGPLSTDYKDWSIAGQLGIDITAEDGGGNTIQVTVRAGGAGYRIELNGKALSVS